MLCYRIINRVGLVRRRLMKWRGVNLKGFTSNLFGFSSPRQTCRAGRASNGQEAQPVDPVANVRTRNPGGVSPRRERIWPSFKDAIMAGDRFGLILRTINPEACSSVFSCVQCSIATGLLCHPPGSAGSVSRPVRTNVLCVPGVEAMQRFCMST